MDWEAPQRHKHEQTTTTQTTVHTRTPDTCKPVQPPRRHRHACAQPARDKVAVQPQQVSKEVMNAFAPYLPGARHFAESAPADALVRGLTGSKEYMGIGGHERFMAASRFQSCGRTQLWCASMSDACTAFRNAGLNQTLNVSSAVSVFQCLDANQAATCRHHGLKLYHSIADEGDVVYLPSGWLLAEKPLQCQMVLGIQVGAPPEAGSLDALMCIRELLAFDNPNSSAVAEVDIA